MVLMCELRASARRIATEFRPRRIIVFGSCVHGTPTVDSGVEQTHYNGWRRRLSATAISLAGVLAGCHDPNDPNINPKAYYALIRDTEARAMSAAVDLRECYSSSLAAEVINPNDGEVVRKYSYALTRQPTPANAFDVYYSPKRRVAWYVIHNEPALPNAETDRETP